MGRKSYKWHYYYYYYFLWETRPNGDTGGSQTKRKKKIMGPKRAKNSNELNLMERARRW